MKIELCFSGWSRNVDLSKLTVTDLATDKVVDITGVDPSIVINKLNRYVWGISLKDVLSLDGRESEIEMFDFVLG